MTDKTLTRIADALEELVDAFQQAQRQDHYALTDRYAANEARQREAAEPDPLDEDDHRDRIDRKGVRWSRRRSLWCEASCTCPEGAWRFDEITHRFGPLTFAPDTSPAPQDAAQDAAEGAGDAVEGAGAAGPSEALAQQDLRPHMEQIAADAKTFAKALISCPECGHDIESHTDDGCLACDSTGVCLCQRTPSVIARNLIAQAVRAGRERLAQEPDPESVVLPEGWRLDNGHDLIQPGDLMGARVGVVVRDHRTWYAMSAMSGEWCVCDTKQRAVDFLRVEAGRKPRTAKATS